MSTPSSFDNQSNRPAKLPSIRNLRAQDSFQPIGSKLVLAHKEMGHVQMGRRREVNLPGDNFFNKIADNTATNINDNMNLMGLLPEIELIKQLYVSSTLSPKDMADAKLNWRVRDGVFDSEISGPLLDVVSSYFTEVYNIDPLLPDWLEQMLYTKGSKPMMILAESVVDEVINNPNRAAMESFRAELTSDNEFLSIGLLGRGKEGAKPADDEAVTTGVQFAMESFARAEMDTSNHRTGPVAIQMFTDMSKASSYGRVTVTDNPDSMKVPFIRQAARQVKLNRTFKQRNRNNKLLKVSAEDFSGMTDNELTVQLQPGKLATTNNIQAALYGRRRYMSQPVQTMYTRDQIGRRTVGHPLVVEVPPEAVINVFPPGQPDHPIAHFILLQENGYPINKVDQKDYYQEMNANVNSSNDMVSQLIKTTARGIENPQNGKDIDMTLLTQAYADIVEEDLLVRLRNGAYGDDLKIARPEEVYRIMLARTMANQNTRLLFVPTEDMAYMALDYNEYGIGKSRLEDVKILASMRAILLFSYTMAAMKNSVGRVRLNIKLSSVDDDPSGTVEFLIHEYAKNRQSAYPLGASNPLDIISFLQNAGVEVVVSGNDGYPDTQVTAEDFTSNRAKPDMDLDNALNERLSNALGVPLEMVTNAKGPEFATTAVRNNLLFAKRVTKDKRNFTANVTEFVQKFTYNSGALLEDLRSIVKANKDKLDDNLKNLILDRNEVLNVDAVVKLFIESIVVELPEAEMAKISVQLESFEEYTKALDAILPAYLSPEMFQGLTADDVEGSFGTLMNIAKGHYQREFLRDNNIMPALFELTTFNEDGSPAVNMLQIFQNHADGIQKSMGQLLDNMKAIGERRAGAGEGTGTAAATSDLPAGEENPDSVDGYGAGPEGDPAADIAEDTDTTDPDEQADSDVGSAAAEAGADATE